MGKASRRKHAQEQQRLYFDIKGDARNAADRAQASAMLDKLQQKLVDDAQREDGFYFLDGQYVEARRPRFTPGMKTQTFAGHTRRITHVALVPMDAMSASPSMDLNSFVVTCGTDWCDLQPSVAVFDTVKSTFQPLPDTSPSLWDMDVGHQQQITCMTFSHGVDDAPLLLATGSLDSTCIVWQTASNDNQPKLTMLLILPVAEVGVSSIAFTHDDAELLAVGGDGTIKVWRIDSAADDINTAADQLHQQRVTWQRAIPFTLTIPRTQELLRFDDTLPSFHRNDQWLLHEQRRCLRKTDSLQAPTLLESREEPTAESTEGHEDREKNAPDEKPSRQDQQHDAETADPTFSAAGIDTPIDRAGSSRIVDEALDAIERLRREYEKMDSFDFERLLNPATPVLDGKDGDHTRIPLECVTWPALAPDGDGRLLRTFTRRKANGDFAAHTSHVAACAVAKEVDLVVTVSFDKSILCWSMSQGLVRSITRDAHVAPLTCCALTSPTTTRPIDLELLLATAAKDNLVKVWRFESLDSCALTCVYTLAGHYDAPTTLCFDASGVFLVSASDDTLAHCWRVRPAPPDAPAKPVVGVVDRFAITIEWKVPLANGAPLTKYLVRTEQLSSLTSDGSDVKPVKDREVDVKYKTATIDTLQPGIQYRLSVAAINRVGQSQWSEATDCVETLAFAPSKIAKAVQYRDMTATSVRLSWKVPSPNGATITSYTIKVLPENAMFVPTMETPVPIHELSIVTSEPEAASRRRLHPVKLKLKKPALKNAELGPAEYEYVLYGLWPGEVYQFIVAAENRCGVGEFSPFSDYIKMDSTAPDPPAPPTITRVDKRRADVTWVKPRSNGSEILQYIIEWTQASDETDDASETSTRSSVTLLTKSIVGTAYMLTGLRPGRLLRAWVAATNLVNGKLTASPFSAPSDVVYTQCDVPDTPDKPRLESPTAHSVVVAVTPPCANGAPIVVYRLSLFSEELQFGIVTRKQVREVELAPDDFDASPSGSILLRVTLLQLRAKMFYSATVIAINALGNSQTSESSVAVSTKAPVVPATILVAPVVRDVEPTQATISWCPPDHDGGVALASVVLQYSVNGGAFEHEIVLFQGSELVLEQLKPRTSYAFCVTTANAMGRAEVSPACAAFTTPSLVDYTIATYFASRPPVEHRKAVVLQRRYRLWKRRTHERRVLHEQLTAVLASSWHLL